MGRVRIGDMPEKAKVSANAAVSRRRPLGLYSDLGVRRHATAAQIESAYQKWSDATTAQLKAAKTSQSRSACTQRQARLDEAYTTLTEAASRKQYDALLFGTNSTERVREFRKRQSVSEKREEHAVKYTKKKLRQQDWRKKAKKKCEKKKRDGERGYPDWEGKWRKGKVGSREKTMRDGTKVKVIRRKKGVLSRDKRLSRVVVLPAQLCNE